MKILYGVQGTGNGHISRARAMAVELQRLGAQVDYLFSGRPADQYFDMEIFGQYRALQGLSFATKDGRVQYLNTARGNSILRFIKEVRGLDLEGYDLMLTDFEPITAWAAKRADKKIIGLGHQYAFNYPIPIAGDSALTRAIMRNFAPVSLGLGLHWHHFGQPILPPIIAQHEDVATGGQDKVTENDGRVLVYLPFENQTEVVQLLQSFQGRSFILFCNSYPLGQHANVEVAPQSFGYFQQRLRHCDGVICNAGFELSSEAFHLGKKLLVKPLVGQMEQLSNAAALEALQLGGTMSRLDPERIGAWLEQGEAVQIRYSNVAQAIARWLLDGMTQSSAELAQRLWQECQCPARPDLFGATRVVLDAA